MLTFLLLAAAAHATTPDPRCNSVKTDDLMACAEADRRNADAALNLAYQAALRMTRGQDAALAPAKPTNGGLGYSAALLASERAWLAFRDAQCRVETYASYDGHELPIYQRDCLARLTRQRAEQLKALVAPR